MCNLDAVPQAVTRALAMLRANLAGFLRVVMRKMRGSTTMAWMARPASTVTMYMPRRAAMSAMSSVSTNLAATRKMIPNGEYLYHHREVLSVCRVCHQKRRFYPYHYNQGIIIDQFHRQTSREIERQTDRHANRLTDRLAESQTGEQMDSLLVV